MHICYTSRHHFRLSGPPVAGPQRRVTVSRRDSVRPCAIRPGRSAHLQSRTRKRNTGTLRESRPTAPRHREQCRRLVPRHAGAQNGPTPVSQRKGHFRPGSPTAPAPGQSSRGHGADFRAVCNAKRRALVVRKLFASHVHGVVVVQEHAILAQ